MRQIDKVIEALNLNCKVKVISDPGWYDIELDNGHELTHLCIRSEIIEKWPLEKAVQYIRDIRGKE